MAYFDEVTLADGEMAVMDGGIHGVQGHTVVLAADGSARWTRRAESLMPRGSVGSGRFQVVNEELEQLALWREAAWHLAEAGTSFYPPLDPGRGPQIPRWVWRVALRRGATVRILEGGSVESFDPPPTLRPLLDWLRARVDGLAGEEPSLG